MKQFIIILASTCLCIGSSFAVERCNTIGSSDVYVSDQKYQNIFPYSIELTCNNIKYNWNGSAIIARLQKRNKLIDYKNFINNIPNVIYDFKKKFHENSEKYFKYLLEKPYNNIENNITQISNNKILETYNNPFKKNPFIFKIDNEIFQWKNSKIIISSYGNKYRNRLHNVLIAFNDSWEYFLYLLQKFVNVQSYKINISPHINMIINYNHLTFDTSIHNPFNHMIVIKDSLRTYRWNKNTVEILFPDWLNDNLSKNNYIVFLQLLEKATKNFNQNSVNKHTLDYFEYFIQQEFGDNIIVYALNMDNLGWETITNINKTYISTVDNHNTGFIEIDKINAGYDFENNENDF